MGEFDYGEPKIEPGFICVGIAGSTGSGKTYSAMELMVGIVGDGNFAVLDTEQGRATHYHKKRLGDRGFEFSHALFNPPYSADRYKKGIEAAAKQGVKGLVIDSLSHLWEGEGGTQDQVDKKSMELARKYGGDVDKFQFSAWQEPKKQAWLMIQYAKTCGLHVVFCMRAKTKSKMEKVERNGRMKTEIIPQGYMPVVDSALPFEMDFCATLDPDHAGVPTFTYKPLALQFHGLFKPGQMFSREHGKELLKWCNIGKQATPQETKPAQKQSADDDKITIKSPDGRSKKISKAKAVDILIASIEKCDSTDQVWAYVNENSSVTNHVSNEDKARYDTACANIIENLESREMAAD